MILATALEARVGPRAVPDRGGQERAPRKNPPRTFDRPEAVHATAPREIILFLAYRALVARFLAGWVHGLMDRTYLWSKLERTDNR